MRAFHVKNQVACVGLISLSLVGCVHQHQQSAKGGRPLASSQSAAPGQRLALTSNTGGTAVASDPTQWPEKPSEQMVRSRFNQLFPSVAERESKPVKVVTSPPETELAGEPAAEQPTEKSSEVKVASKDKRPAPNTPATTPVTKPTDSDTPSQSLNAAQLARLSQQSAGAISVVAAMVSLPTEPTVAAKQEKTSEPEVAKKEPVQNAAADQVKPREALVAQQPEPRPVPVSEPVKAMRPVKPESIDIPGIPTVTEVAKTESKRAAVELIPEQLQEKPSTQPAKSVETSVAQQEAALPPIPPIGSGEPHAKVARVDAASKLEAVEKPVLEPAATNNSPTAQPAQSKKPENLSAIPALPPLAEISESIKVAASNKVQEAQAPSNSSDTPLSLKPALNQAPPLTVDEVLASNNKTASSAQPAQASQPAKPEEKAPAELRPLLPGIPSVPTQVTDTENDASDTPVAASEVHPSTIKADKPSHQLAVPSANKESTAMKPPVVESASEKLPADLPQTALPALVATDSNPVSVESSVENARPEAIARREVTELKSSADLPPPTPAPELNLPGLNDAPVVPPALAPGESPAATSDKRVERSSAPSEMEAELQQMPANQAVPADATPETTPKKDITEKKDQESPADPAVPVLKPLPDDQADAKPKTSAIKSFTLAKGNPLDPSAKFSWPKAIGTRLSGIKGKASHGVTTLTSSASGMFDWRKKDFDPTVGHDAAQASASFSSRESASQEFTLKTPGTAPSVEPGITADSQAQGLKKQNVVTQNGLPPVEFPASYRTNARTSANPWADQVNPAVNLAKLPPQYSLNQQVAMSAQAKTNWSNQQTPVRNSVDLNVMPTSISKTTQPVAAEKAEQVKQLASATPSKKSWWSKAGQNLRSIFSDQDEVVPPKSQDPYKKNLGGQSSYSAHP